MQIKTENNAYHKVKENDTIEEICFRYKVDKQELLKLNNIMSISAGDVVLMPKSYKLCYIVKPLDTPESIAQKLGIPACKIVAAAKNKNLFIGQKLLL